MSSFNVNTIIVAIAVHSLLSVIFVLEIDYSLSLVVKPTAATLNSLQKCVSSPHYVLISSLEV
jgi:uncharacterized protein YoxC